MNKQAQEGEYSIPEATQIVALMSHGPKIVLVKVLEGQPQP